MYFEAIYLRFWDSQAWETSGAGYAAGLAGVGSSVFFLSVGGSCWSLQAENLSRYIP